MTAEPAAAHADLPPPELIEDRAGLDRLLARLEGEREIAVDTEADSFFNYQEKVCLVQLSAGGVDSLIDPLSGLDLAPLGRVFADPDRVKVFHDGEYDVLILKRDYGFEFAGIFDTRVAAAALGYSQPGLASVLENHFGIKLDKSMQRSDWSRRPLSPKQIAYARLDTHFLVPLMHRMTAELSSRGRMEVVAGECRRLEALEPPERVFDPDEFVRVKGARTLDPAGLQVLRELFILRDRLARQRDVPPFKILGTQALLDLARRAPASARQLERSEILSKRQVRQIGEEVAAAVKRAQAKGPLKKLPDGRPKDPAGFLNDEQSELHERLKNWRKERAEAEGYDASLVLNRHALQRLAQARPSDREALVAVEGVLPWQVDRFGDDLLEVVARFERALAAGELKELLKRRRMRRRNGPRLG